MKNIFLALFVTIGLFAQAQSPWTLDKGKAYSQLSLSFIPEYTSAFNVDSTNGGYQLPRSVQDLELQLYGEYGIIEGLTVIAKIPYKSVKTTDVNPSSNIALNEEAKISGVGNVTIGLKKSILKKDKYLLTAFGDFSVPSDVMNQASGLRTGYNAWLFGGGLSFGGNWKHGYYFANAGAQFASKNISHSFRSEIEFGYN